MVSGCRRGSKGCLIRVGEFDTLFHFSMSRLIAGVVTDFCGSMITYPNYKFYFPVKALGMYMKRYGDEELL